jgi:hypothetical protein
VCEYQLPFQPNRARLRAFMIHGGSSIHAVQVASLPDKWLAKLRSQIEREPTKPNFDFIPEGRRNSVLTSLAGTMKRGGIDPRNGGAETLNGLISELGDKCRS